MAGLDGPIQGAYLEGSSPPALLFASSLYGAGVGAATGSSPPSQSQTNPSTGEQDADEWGFAPSLARAPGRDEAQRYGGDGRGGQGADARAGAGAEAGAEAGNVGPDLEKELGMKKYKKVRRDREKTTMPDLELRQLPPAPALAVASPASGSLSARVRPSLPPVPSGSPLSPSSVSASGSMSGSVSARGGYGSGKGKGKGRSGAGAQQQLSPAERLHLHSSPDDGSVSFTAGGREVTLSRSQWEQLQRRRAFLLDQQRRWEESQRNANRPHSLSESRPSEEDLVQRNPGAAQRDMSPYALRYRASGTEAPGLPAANLFASQAGGGLSLAAQAVAAASRLPNSPIDNIVIQSHAPEEAAGAGGPTERRFPSSRRWHNPLWGALFLLQLGLFFFVIFAVDEAPRSLRLAGPTPISIPASTVARLFPVAPTPSSSTPSSAPGPGDAGIEIVDGPQSQWSSRDLALVRALAVERSRSASYMMYAAAAIGVVASFFVWLSWNYTAEASIGFLPTMVVMTSGVMLLATLILFIAVEIVPGIVMLVMLVFQFIHARVLLTRIDKTVHIVQAVMNALGVFPAVGKICLASLGSLAVLSLLWSYLVSRAMLMSTYVPMLAYLFFSLFWATSSLRAALAFVASGSVMPWLMLGPARTPRFPTVSALFRVATKDFGAVCLAALVVPPASSVCGVIDTAVARVLFGLGARSDPHGLVAEGLLGFLRRNASPFAAAQLAVYDKTFRQASNDAWGALVLRRITALARRDILASTAFHVSFSWGCISAAAAVVWASREDLTHAVGLLGFAAFALTYLSLSLTLEPVLAAVYSAFMAMAEDPLSVQEACPQVFRALITELPAEIRRSIVSDYDAHRDQILLARRIRTSQNADDRL